MRELNCTEVDIVSGGAGLFDDLKNGLKGITDTISGLFSGNNTENNNLFGDLFKPLTDTINKLGETVSGGAQNFMKENVKLPYISADVKDAIFAGVIAAFAL